MMSNYDPEHINYALVEDVRPPMYSAMKYWGRKPHNIWADYIEHYCPCDGIVLDPFVGSGITAFEGVKLGRKVIATDLNPLSSFVIDVVTSKFDEQLFKNTANNIIESVCEDPIYRRHFVKKVDDVQTTVYNYLWVNGHVVSVRLRDAKKKALVLKPDRKDKKNESDMLGIKIDDWIPSEPFPNHPSVNESFISKIGGNDIGNLWTRRNLYVLARLFDLIQKVSDKNVRIQLMLSFVHTLHLVSKMVVPRAEKGNRDFSGSWGRADYMIRARSLEQNPIIVFQRSCFDKQGVIRALTDANERLKGKVLKVNELGTKRKYKSKASLNYGTVDVADIGDLIEKDTIDFIITDPPYGGLVQYMDLSMVWLVWLKKFDAKYTPDSSGEITYKKGITSRDTYRKRLTNAFRVMYRLLKPEHYLVVTFHNQSIEEWNYFVGAIRESGFVFEKVTHQYNKRSGESNVSNPYGTTGSDFYIRCKKTNTKHQFSTKDDLSRFVINRTMGILVSRGEPTPFEFLLNGLLPDILQAGYLHLDTPATELRKILDEETGPSKMFCVKKNENQHLGDILWFNKPDEHISHMSIPLSQRVEMTVKSFLRRRLAVKYDDVVAEIFREFPNGQTPDPHGIVNVLKKFANMSSGKWKLKDGIEKECTEHTSVIASLCLLAKKGKLLSYVGKREKPEPVSEGKKLLDIETSHTLDSLSGYSKEELARLSMVDMIWLNRSNSIAAVFEVENSTDFIGAISRASWLSYSIPKFMIIPEKRKKEFLSYKDPFFKKGFVDNNWKYLFYRDIELLKTAGSISLAKINSYAKGL